jgi:hypothetical protein
MARFITRVADQCRQRAAEERFLKRFSMTAPEAADDEAAGPGWYESSRELETGLLVREGTPGDELLAAWHEARRRGVVPSAAAVVQATV